MKEPSKLNECNMFFGVVAIVVVLLMECFFYRTISWKKFKTMVQQKYNDDTNQLNTIIKHLQTLWNLTRNLLGK